MKKNTLLVCILLFVAGILGCQVMAGECWPVSEDGEGQGAGGGPLVPGSGGFGDVPPEPQATGDSPPPGCVEIGSYSPSLFKFKTILPDDGTDKGGGYQEATAGVKFVDGRQHPAASWTCSVTVGMPLRTAKHGTLSASRAAEIAADVLTSAASPTMHSRTSWVPALFCRKLEDTMVGIFKTQYDGLGARAKAQ
jgi:hypothetical protein